MDRRLPPLHYLPQDQANEADFARTLRERSRDYLSGHRDHRYANAGRLAKAALLSLACLTAYLACLWQSSASGFLAAYMGSFLSCMLLNVDVNHDASHQVFLRSRRGNRLVSRAVTLLIGIDPDYWRVRHVEFHHVHPNIEHYDLDTEENGFFRQTPFQRWRTHMRWQHLYWPLMAALSLLWIAWVMDWRDRLGKTPLRERRLLPGIGGWIRFLGSKFGHFLLALGFPLLAARANDLPAGFVIGSYLASMAISSLLLVFLLLGTHWAQATFYQPPADGQLASGWHAHNFATACDWMPSPRWLQCLTGGLNLHLTHHLYPGWHHRHYEALAEIIARTAAEYGFPYRRLGYRELFHAQQTFLQGLGRQPGEHAS